MAETEKELLQLKKRFAELAQKSYRQNVYCFSGFLSLAEQDVFYQVKSEYPETDCTILCIKLDDMERPMAVTLPRFAVGGRWFDDVVDNNARREAEKNGCEG